MDLHQGLSTIAKLNVAAANKISTFPTQSNERIRIVPFNEGHLTERYVSWLNDPEVMKYSDHNRHLHTLESAKEYYKGQLYAANWFLAVESIEDTPQHIGNIGVYIDAENNSAELSILIGDKRCWGKNIATMAWQIALDTLLEEMDFRVVVAGTMDANKPMIRLMEKTGMTVDAVLPRRFVWQKQEIGIVCASKFSIKNRFQK